MLKGKGADLFFGGTQEPAAEHQDLEAPQNGRLVIETAGPVSTALAADHVDAAALPPDRVGGGADAPPAAARGAARHNAGYHARTLASMDKMTEAIRRVVKHTGREVAVVRLSAEEKRRLADIVYTYKRQGVMTTETEINRIAINLLLEDYDANGGTSVLARVLASLRA